VAATISALDTGYGAPIAAETDSDGVYSLWLLPGTYSLQAAAAGYVTQTVDVDVLIEQTTVQDFRLMAEAPGQTRSYLPLVIR
jgi:hypothetical protein